MLSYTATRGDGTLYGNKPLSYTGLKRNMASPDSVDSSGYRIGGKEVEPKDTPTDCAQKVKVLHGKDPMAVDLPPGTKAYVIEKRQMPVLPNPSLAIAEALMRPIRDGDMLRIARVDLQCQQAIRLCEWPVLW